MIGIYLSGTGNTKHCIEKLLHLLDETAQAIPIESEEAVERVLQHDFIILAYPVQFSNSPVIIRDFIKPNSTLCVQINTRNNYSSRSPTYRLTLKNGSDMVSATIGRCRGD